MTKDMSDRIKALGFLMTCVIAVYHCFFYGEAVNSLDLRLNKAVDLTAETIASVAMCWFFSVSGFLLFRNLTFKNFGDKLKRRTYSLLLPYFIWQVGVEAVSIIMSALRHNLPEPKEELKYFVESVFLMKEWPPDGALWYLYALFWLALLSPLLLLLFKNKKLGWCAVIALTVLIYRLNYADNFITQTVFSYGYLRNIISYFPAFLIGAFMGHFSESSDGTDKLKYIISLLLVSIIFESLYPGIIMNSFIKILPMLLLYFMPLATALRERKIYCLSFLIYAVHKPLLYVKKFLMPVLSSIIPYAFFANIMLRLVFLVIVIAAAALLHFALRKLSPKLLNVVTGGRA